VSNKAIICQGCEGGVQIKQLLVKRIVDDRRIETGSGSCSTVTGLVLLNPRVPLP
jgi:hypothetical protein